jgi:hypothetical protein
MLSADLFWFHYRISNLIVQQLVKLLFPAYDLSDVGLNDVKAQLLPVCPSITVCMETTTN